jgi:hypothetical protein
MAPNGLRVCDENQVRPPECLFNAIIGIFPQTSIGALTFCLGVAPLELGRLNLSLAGRSATGPRSADERTRRQTSVISRTAREQINH